MSMNRRVGMSELKTIKIQWTGHDEIELCFNSDLKVSSLKANVCFETMVLLQGLVKVYKDRPLNVWKLPSGNSHSDMLVREMLLKATDKWEYPYNEEILCRCRLVTTQYVDQAILNGAHTPISIMLKTGAGAACGSCQPHASCIIQYRLKKTLE